MTTQEQPHRMKWSLNTVWYLFLEVMQKYGIDVSRAHIKRTVKQLCDSKGITRESLGIYAGVRAELYFKGAWTSVSFDDIQTLALKGTDMVFVEKEGIPEVLTDFADKHGLAMVNTRGHLTEYGKGLMMAAKASGAHVVIMADYDASGIKIASESPTEMPWIGANDKMLAYFHLSRDSVKIDSESTANKAIVRELVESGRHREGRIDTRFEDVDIDFLDGERVELDAILAKVGDERFFQYILDTLEELYPKRNYNRAIEVPTKDFGARHDESLNLIDARVMEFITPEIDKIKEELGDVKGFLDVNEELDDIKDRLIEALEGNEEYEDFTDRLSELVESHPFFNKEGGND